MRTDFLQKEQYEIEDLLKIMQILRGENGCPWDREQTHASIRQNLLEEAYEAADAIDTRDTAALCEELGDVLLQVVFHCEMERERGSFDFSAVADGVCKKLILRHPHIFGDVKADTADEVLKNWDRIKKEEKGQASFTDTMKSVPRAFPALMRAQKVQKRASRAGFDWADPAGALDKVDEERAELAEAAAGSDPARTAEEAGDLLFAAVNAVRLSGVDAEEALAAATDKFIARFERVEALAGERGVKLPGAPLEELDRLWDEIKLH